MANFAERIRALRKEKGLSQEEVGSVIGLKKYAVYSYEKGRASSPWRTTSTSPWTTWPAAPTTPTSTADPAP